jgi:O-acetyl-ADP-ribose deacetylase (regulator of RNase III)
MAVTTRDLCWSYRGSEMKLNVVLASIDTPLAEAWQRFCGDLPGVTIHRGSILDAPCDAVVSPANSFGFMDGGIDLSYARHFGWKLEQRLQELIRTEHHGELLVGHAVIVATDNARIPFLIAAPTMRVPMILRETVNPYLAARAALLLIKHGQFREGPFAGARVDSVVRIVAFPGLGTGVGKVGPNICARQVRAAIEEVILERTSFPQSWADAQSRHQLLYGNRFRDLQRE